MRQRDARVAALWALAPVAFLQQVGLGVTVDALLDTLLVRPFLLPATAVLLRRASGTETI